MPKKINMLLVGGLTVVFLGAETQSVGGVLGSFGLWLHTFWRKHRPDEIQRNLARLPALMREAKSLSVDRLSEIEEYLDTLSDGCSSASSTKRLRRTGSMALP